MIRQFLAVSLAVCSAAFADVAALYGPAISTTSRTDCGWDVITNRYRKGPQRVEATFIEGVLVRYTLSEE